ncbi:MAG: hypothetical protein C0504_18790 [Candidatus Solibacter sp.]|nr:hypothetical protein [Candidatus Solibacter sp.]
MAGSFGGADVWKHQVTLRRAPGRPCHSALDNYRLGETRIGYWHEIDGGFRGRRAMGGEFMDNHEGRGGEWEGVAGFDTSPAASLH